MVWHLSLGITVALLCGDRSLEKLYWLVVKILSKRTVKGLFEWNLKIFKWVEPSECARVHQDFLLILRLLQKIRMACIDPWGFQKAWQFLEAVYVDPQDNISKFLFWVSFSKFRGVQRCGKGFRINPLQGAILRTRMAWFDPAVN